VAPLRDLFLLNKVQKVQVSDTTDDHQGTEAGNKKPTTETSN
jgi:hypothetical protein